MVQRQAEIDHLFIKQPFVCQKGGAKFDRRLAAQAFQCRNCLGISITGTVDIGALPAKITGQGIDLIDQGR